DAITLSGSADHARHREAQPRRVAPLAGKHVQDELASRVRPALPEDPIEIGAARQPGATRTRAGAWSPEHQTASRLRPFARRRLSVSRPARVRIRARNPCVRARLRFFGW